MPSPYAPFIPDLIQEVDIAFLNQFRLISGFQPTDYLPGDRYGILDFQTYARDPDRPNLGRVRGGAEAKVLRASILLSIAFDGSGKSDQENYRQANTLFVQECLNLEHGLAEMHGPINNQQFVWELELDGSIDKGVSVTLRDSDTWLVNVTADVVLRLMVLRAIDGSHIYPLSLSPSPHA